VVIAIRPPLMLYAYVAALVGGILLAMGHYVGGAVLVAVALILAGARFIADQRGEDESTYLH
jgi:hypothetical protein